MKDLYIPINFVFTIDKYPDNPHAYALGFKSDNEYRYKLVITEEELLEMKHAIEAALSEDIQIGVDYGQGNDKSAFVTIKRLPNGTYQITDIKLQDAQ